MKSADWWLVGTEGLTVEINSSETAWKVPKLLTILQHFTESKPCPKEHEEKCEASGNKVISCVVDPLFPDQPECKCHLGFKKSEAGICVGMGYNFPLNKILIYSTIEVELSWNACLKVHRSCLSRIFVFAIGFDNCLSELNYMTKAMAILFIFSLPKWHMFSNPVFEKGMSLILKYEQY